MGAGPPPSGAPPGGGAEDFAAAAAAGAAAPLNAVWNQDPWAVTLLDTARQFGVQLLCAGGSGAAAKTAVAPLERAKVRRRALPTRCRAAPRRHSLGPAAARRRPRGPKGSSAPTATMRPRLAVALHPI